MSNISAEDADFEKTPQMPTFSLFIDDLPSSVSEDELIERFEPAGGRLVAAYFVFCRDSADLGLYPESAFTIQVKALHMPTSTSTKKNRVSSCLCMVHLSA
jgi:hypothetical protein